MRTLISLAVEAEDEIEQYGMEKEKIIDVCFYHLLGRKVQFTSIQAILQILRSRREMLNEYFSMSINAEDELESLPLLLRDYTPNLDKLPLFLMRLCPQVSECARSAVRH